MPKKLTQEDFIRRAKEVHGDKYDYSKVEYVNNRVKVSVICHEKFPWGEEHGEFKQAPASHLNGMGCPVCSNVARLTTDTFIKKARYIHGDKYDYSHVEYQSAHKKIQIVCPIHGIFIQKPCDHLQGKGCLKCSGSEKKTTEQFITEAKAIHGDKYDYGLVDYTNNKCYIQIKCKKHNYIFRQQALKHLQGQGCPLCKTERVADSHRYDTALFIKQAQKVHGDDCGYDKVEYVGCHDRVKIFCHKCGEYFYQRPFAHLFGYGCPRCRESQGERKVEQWLKSHNIKYLRQYPISSQLQLFSRNHFKIDFYLIDYNTFIEFNGSQHYCKNEFFHKTEEDFIIQQDRDRRLREYCKQNDITLIEIPYTKFKEIDKILEKKIRAR